LIGVFDKKKERKKTNGKLLFEVTHPTRVKATPLTGSLLWGVKGNHEV
jgi:hypothetical protein